VTARQVQTVEYKRNAVQ